MGKCLRKGKGFDPPLPGLPLPMTMETREAEWTESNPNLLLYRILIPPEPCPTERVWQAGAPRRPGLEELRDGKSSIFVEVHRSTFRITSLLLLAGIIAPLADTQPSLVFPWMHEEEPRSTSYSAAASHQSTPHRLHYTSKTDSYNPTK